MTSRKEVEEKELHAFFKEKKKNKPLQIATKVIETETGLIESISQPPLDSWNSDQIYDKLLNRVYMTLKQLNPRLTEEQKKTVLNAPQVTREGSKKTVFTNFRELCDNMNRSYDHVSNFISTELGSSVSLDANMRLVIKGRFLPKAFENIIRRYMTEYVLCYLCKSPETSLNRDKNTRLILQNCRRCGASKSLFAIKNTFRARTVSRKIERTNS